MTLDTFIAKYTGKKLDWDNAYGGQLYMKVFLFCFLSSFNRIPNVVKTTKEFLAIVNLYLGRPLISGFIPPNTSNPTRVIRPSTRISKVSGVRTNTKVGASIVKSISINMVNILTFFWLHNPSVKLNKVVSRKSFLKVIFSSFLNSRPFHALKRFHSLVIMIINKDCMVSASLAIESNIHIDKSITCPPISQRRYDIR